MNLWFLACLVTCFMDTWAPGVQAQGLNYGPSRDQQSDRSQRTPKPSPLSLLPHPLAPASPPLSTSPPGVFEDCCLAYHLHVKLPLLRRAQSYQRQDVSGSCNLPAVIFYFPHRRKMVCGNPQARWVQYGMKLLDKRNKALPKHHQNARRNFQGSHSGGKKLSSGPSRLPLSIFRHHTRNSEKNASLPATANPGL